MGHRLELGQDQSPSPNSLLWLKQFQELPDVFIVPSEVIFKYFNGGGPKTWRRARYHPKIGEISQYKNKWDLLKKALHGGI